MAELSAPDPPRVPRVLRVLPVVALVAGVVGLLDHVIGAVAALMAIMAVIGTTLLRLVLEARTWRWPTDALFLLATVGLVLVIVVGALLGLRT
ncbi:MAG: hypothetical protein R6U94_13800 [Nitriliruptoraceae bacterium]